MKRRGIILTLVAILLIAALVSCSDSSDVISSGEGYVTFDKEAMTKGLSSSYSGYEPYDNLFWYYKAEKKDQYGITGETGDDLMAKVPGFETGAKAGRGLSGKVGPFSEGDWSFTLYAYKTALSEVEEDPKRYEYTTDDLVYQGSTSSIIKIKRDQTNYIPVTVTPNGTTGTVLFNAGFYYSWQVAGAGDVDTLYLTAKGTFKADNADATDKVFTTKELRKSGDKYYIFGNLTLQESASNDLPVGLYTVEFAVRPDEESDDFQRQTIAFRVMPGLTTVISGNLLEGLSYDNYFEVPEQDIQLFTASSTDLVDVTAKVVPQKEETSGSKTTTVTFPAGSLDTTNSQHSLEVKVTPVEVAPSKFTVTKDGATAIAGIDLTLTKIVTTTTTTEQGTTTTSTEVPVTEFKGQSVTISTYIEKGLEEVNVKYNGTDGKAQPEYEKVGEFIRTYGTEGELTTGTTGYVPSTGLLVFKTNHFSEYYVEAKAVAQNVTTKKLYSSFETAIDEVQDGQTITMLCNVDDAHGISVPSGKNFTVDFAGHTYSVEKPGAGSPNTKTQAFQLLKDSTIVFKNGTIECAVENKDFTWKSTDTEKGIAMIIQNYANLTLDNMTIDGTNIAHNGNNDRYVVSTNNGTTTIKNTTITAVGKDFAFDSYDDPQEQYPGKPTVTVQGNSVITGKVEASGGIIDIQSGTVNGMVRVGENKKIDDETYGGNTGSVVTIGKDATVNCQGSYVAVFGPQTLHIYGKVNGCVSTNGNAYNADSVINVYEGAKITNSTYDAAHEYGDAIYCPNGSLNIYGGTITGTTAVYFKSTNLSISGGTLTGNGDAIDYDYNGNGGKATGDALVIDSCNYPNGIKSVSISGGVFESENADAVGSYTYGEAESVPAFITGGTFSSNPSAYVANGYEVVALNPEQGNLKFKVEAFTPVAKIVRGSTTLVYKTLAEAIEAVEDNNPTTITILSNVVIQGNDGCTIKAGKDITIDLNGQTIKNNVNENKASQVFTVKGSLTITDSSENQTGLITNSAEPGTKTGEWWSTPQYNYATNLITNNGTLTIKAGKLINTAASSICYAIDNNSSGSDATLNIEGGWIQGQSTAVRMFCNSTTKENKAKITGGTIQASYAGLWIQLPGNGQQKLASLEVSGGTLKGEYAFYDYSFGDLFDKVNYTISGGEFDGRVFSYGANVTITGGQFKNTIEIKHEKNSSQTVAVSGGIFSSDPSEYVAVGYKVNSVNNDDNAPWTVEKGDYVFDGIEFILGNNTQCYEIQRSWAHPEQKPIKILRRLITLTLEEPQNNQNNNTFIVKHGDTVLECSGEDLRDIVGDNEGAAKGILDGDVILLPSGDIYSEGTAGDPISFYNTTLVGHENGTTLHLKTGSNSDYRCFRLYHRNGKSVLEEKNTIFANLYRLTITRDTTCSSPNTALFYTTAYGGTISMKNVAINEFKNLFSIWGAETLTGDDYTGKYPTKDDNRGIDVYLRGVTTDSATDTLIAFQSGPWTNTPTLYSYGAISYDDNCKTNSSTFVSAYAWDSRSISGQENAFINGQLVNEAKPAK